MRFLDGLHRANLDYLEEQFALYQKDPQAVDRDWQLFFSGLEFGQTQAAPRAKGGGQLAKELGAFRFVKALRDAGHLEATLNPLGESPKSVDFLKPTFFGLVDSDLNQTFESVKLLLPWATGTLQATADRLRKLYSGSFAIDVTHCPAPVADWFHREVENPSDSATSDDKKMILEKLVAAEAFEKFVHTRFVGAKRFSIEGGDVLIPMLEKAIARGAELGMKELVIGMAHRGRLNVLVNVMGKDPRYVFREFEGARYENDPSLDGDVKYHLGFSADRVTPQGNVHLSLGFNPSHLEAICPVALGMVRAKQRRHQDTQLRKKVIPILIHGEAAFAGQGVVSETLQLSQLEGYRVGGTVHFVIDNQIGFTTNPVHQRSMTYSADLAKSISAPVIHANGDDPEASVRAADLALRFRQEFGQDAVVEITCYRRFGHNEGDEPAFTQPVMYQKIKDHPPVREIYAKRLAEEGVISEHADRAELDKRMNEFDKKLEDTKSRPPRLELAAFDGLWKGFRVGRLEDMLSATDTRVPLDVLKKVGGFITQVPDSIQTHPKLQRLLETRRKMATGAEPCDWGMAELLCYGSLISEGTSVRLSGQDCMRGTFSHRHSVYFDVRSNEPYSPLAKLNPPTEFCVYNSPLSEMGVLGFEYGNSCTDPTFLTIWEAQFGDFSNGAQIIIDQFISSGEAKWFRMNGLVLFLPHGYEGQGPEHSSARMERYLQLCAQGNMQVCHLTTPAQLFHVLRRQVKRPFRKPLVMMTPKSLLRHPLVKSSLEELGQGAFTEVIDDAVVANPAKVERVVFCTGKFYYDLAEHRQKNGDERVALVRLEQVYPFHEKRVGEVFARYSRAKQWVWAQEEPKNMGAYSFVGPRFQQVLTQMKLGSLTYVGRSERASPATGSHHFHEEEQHHIVQECFA